ncbi:Aminoglycoside N3-acetyltransferase [Alteracholeplasma palmae J233]|uniref:Aminoglycoside N(3)-acetyltransferase n=1 Tax=Alteracholeplasma palmae (strain ATCC 49389 / J233) TaxID=1318466 RepID=U4KKM7_ALTPJ|nr:AAC(3) family N-acetyltransferase [Alteracholeplasma palmae]CCV64319.1 Aminoglycoside N3-acetyltransferase [Alteracholeplasma palmae J233]
MIEQLRQMGLKPTDTVLIHSSMKKINRDVNEVIDVLSSYFKEGLVLMPTHTWKQMNADYNYFDSKIEPSCVGLLTETFRKKEGVVRSLHPTHSMAGLGKNASKYLSNEEYSQTPTPAKGAWGRLGSADAKILLIGCDFIRNTFIHAVEEMMDVPNRFTAIPITFKIKTDHGIHVQKTYKHYNALYPHLSENFKKCEAYLIEKGIVKKGFFGDAEVLYMNAKELEEVIKKWLREDIDLFSDDLPLETHNIEL